MDHKIHAHEPSFQEKLIYSIYSYRPFILLYKHLTMSTYIHYTAVSQKLFKVLKAIVKPKYDVRGERRLIGGYHSDANSS